MYQDTIEQIVEVLELGSTALSKDNLQMLCPFHKEENASFGIHTDEGIYNCLACGAKGHISKLGNNLRSHLVAEEIEDISDYRIITQVDTTKAYSEKPPSIEMGNIRNRLSSMENIKRYRIGDLITLILRGHTVCSSGARTNNEWKSQQLFMLDFDNDSSAVTMSDVLEYAEGIGLVPTFSYYTFSSTDEIQRFRFVYCFKEPITNRSQMQSIINNLLKKFKDFPVDKACNDLCRMFLGSNNYDGFTSNYIYSANSRFTEEQLNSVDKILNKFNLPSFYEGKRFKPNLLGAYLIKEYNAIVLNKSSHIYSEGIYINDRMKIEEVITDIKDDLSTYQISETINYLTRKAPRVEQESHFRYIAFKNGVLDIDTRELHQHSPTKFILTSKINIDYVEAKSSSVLVEKFFDDISCNDNSLKRFLFEIIVYCLVRTNHLDSCFMFMAKGSNGKSSYFEIINRILKQSCSNITLKDLSQNRFAPARSIWKDL